MQHFLRQGGFVRQFLSEKLLDLLLSKVVLPQSTLETAWDDYILQNNLEDSDDLSNFLSKQYFDRELLLKKITRPLRLIKFREEKWGPIVNSLYLERKDQFDVITFSMVRSRDFNVMQEVYFKAKDGEETWHSISQQLNPDNPNIPMSRSWLPS